MNLFGLIAIVLLSIVAFIGQRGQRTPYRLSHNFAVIAIFLSLGILFLDMGLDGTSTGHSTFLNLSTELIGGAVTLLFVAVILRQSDTKDDQLLKLIEHQSAKLDILVQRLEQIETSSDKLTMDSLRNIQKDTHNHNSMANSDMVNRNGSDDYII